MATGTPSKAVYDLQNRPITAGGFVKAGPVVFMNVAEQAGLTQWHHTAGTTEKKFIVENVVHVLSERRHFNSPESSIRPFTRSNHG